MVVVHVASSIPKHTGRANAEVSPLKLGEMLLQIVLITQSQSLSCCTRQRGAPIFALLLLTASCSSIAHPRINMAEIIRT